MTALEILTITQAAHVRYEQTEVLPCIIEAALAGQRVVTVHVDPPAIDSILHSLRSKGFELTAHGLDVTIRW